MMRTIERESFERAKNKLEKQAKSFREQRFPSFETWKLGAIKPTPKPQKQTLFDKLKAFFNPIASASEKYHQKHTYKSKSQPSAAKELKSAAISTIDVFSDAGADLMIADALKEASETGGQQLIMVNSSYTNRLHPSKTPTRSNEHEYDPRNGGRDSRER